MSDFVRDRLTWTAYVLLGWFAYLQAAPGLVVPHLRDELHLSYSVAALHVSAFAVGSAVAGFMTARLERAYGRHALQWSSAALMAVGAIGLTTGRTPELTIGSVAVMGLGGGALLAMIQASLADHHEHFRTVALAEANVAASVSYVALVGVLSAAAAVGAGWRVALLVTLVVPLVAWWQSRGRHVAVSAPADVVHGARLPGAFWLAAAMLVCTTAVEWSATSWGATFVAEASDVSADTAVSLMAGFFGGFLAARVLGSRLARRRDPAPLLAWALALSAVGFAVLWTSTAPVQAAGGLALLGLGIGNLFPMALSVTVGVAPRQAGQASSGVVIATSIAVLLAPVTVGALADATSLKTALCVIPVLLGLAATGLALLRRVR